MATPQDRELEYYRSIEDFFATLRGVPHTLSPKDFHLLREWWADQIPEGAVRTGITEAVAKHRDRGESGPVVSLSYCRHAVRAQAKRIAEMQVGAPDDHRNSSASDQTREFNHLAEKLRLAALDHRQENARLADLVDSIGSAVTAAADLPAAAIEEHLFALETSMLESCFDALDDARRVDIDHRARTAAERSAATPEAQERAFKAHRDRFLRELLGLPRLELDG